jgi:hypothetical protein
VSGKELVKFASLAEWVFVAAVIWGLLDLRDG